MTNSSIAPVPLQTGNFSPDQLHRVLHAVALRTAGNQPAAARELIEQALCSVEAWLLQATDEETAHIIIAARANARLRTLALLSEPVLPDPPTEPEPPRPCPSPLPPQPYPAEVR